MTDLLVFARGPGLRWSLTIMVFGMCWRLGRVIAGGRERDLYWVRKAFHVPNARWKLDSYAMHAGLFTAIFGFSGHIVVIREQTGFSWPALPTAIVLFAGAVTAAAMVAVIAHRILSQEPSAFSAFDDYLSWTLVFAAVLTGMTAYPHVGGGAMMAPYRALLTAHLVCVELLMAWLPFGKLGHVALMPIGRAAIRLASLARYASRRA